MITAEIVGNMLILTVGDETVEIPIHLLNW